MDWKNIKISSKKKPQLSENAVIVLEKRYLAKDDTGKTTENTEGLFKRVASYIAAGDSKYGKTQGEINETARVFYEMMSDLQFVPNSPTLMNAGRPLGQLSACFVLPVDD
jgi:ribonucleoside-diphosphate reductase alpha chain